MPRPNSFWTFLVVVLGILALATVTYTQTPGPKQNAASSKLPAPVPVTMTECEGVNNCATWTFLGSQGTGQWPSGDIASLSVERYDADNVVIRRADATGSSAGLTALYTGARHGDRVGGISPPLGRGTGPINPETGMQRCKSLKARHRLCAFTIPAGTCGTWTWNNGHYDGVWAQAGVTANLAVESFTSESVVIRRTDTGARAGYAYVYTGKISAGGDSILNGTWVGVPGTAQAGSAGNFTATWGAALGNNPAARPSPQRVVVPVVPVICVPWFFGVVCG